jgi:hypothetical protein
MTSDEIIRMAQEADAATRFPVAQIPIERLIPFLEHFAALVISAAPALVAQPVGRMSATAKRKADDLMAQGYEVAGYVLEKDGDRSAVLWDAAVRWVTPDERHRLMHVDGSLAAPAPVAQGDDMQQCRKTLAACLPESPLHALSQKALDELDAPDHEAWHARLWELIDAYRKGHDWPLAMRARIKAHIAKTPAAPAPVALTPAQQHADELVVALRVAVVALAGAAEDRPEFRTPYRVVSAAIEATGQEVGAA